MSNSFQYQDVRPGTYQQNAHACNPTVPLSSQAAQLLWYPNMFYQQYSPYEYTKNLGYPQMPSQVVPQQPTNIYNVPQPQVTLPTMHEAQPKKNPLTIVDPSNKQPYDLDTLAAEGKAQVAESKRQKTSSATPPKPNITKDALATVALPVAQLQTESESNSKAELEPIPEEVVIAAPIPKPDSELPIEEKIEVTASEEQSEFEEHCTKDKSEEENEYEEEVETENPIEEEEDEADGHSVQSSESTGDESGASQRIKKYSRDELIKLRNNISANAMSLPTIPSHIRKGNMKQLKRRTMYIKTDLKLDSVANPYVIKKADDRAAFLLKELSMILNKLLEDNMPEIVTEIKKLNLNGKEEISCLVEALTAKATRQTKYSEVFAKFCVHLADVKQLEGFKHLLLSSVKKLFDIPLQTHIAQTNAQIDAKIAESPDEKVKKMLEEDRETAISKKRELFLGIMQFFSYLYVQKMIPDKSAQESLKPFTKPKSQDEMLAIITCLNICGRFLEERIPHILKECITGLENAKKDVKVEQHVIYKVNALVELKARHWTTPEPVLPPVHVLPRPEQGRENIARRIQTHSNMKKTADSQPLINPKSLAISGQKSGSQDKFLGPAHVWTKGSHSNAGVQRINQSKMPHFVNSEVTSESESGKESRPSSASTRKHNAIKATLKIDENLTFEDAIVDAFDAFTLSDSPSFDLLLHEKHKKEFCRKILADNVEKKTDERKMTTDILHHLYKKQQITGDQLYYGFSELLLICDDLLDDLPKADEYIGEFLSAIAMDVPVVFKILKEQPVDRKCKILASCLTVASKRPEDDIAKVYSNSDVDWSSLEVSSFKEFVNKYNITIPKPAAPKEKRPKGSRLKSAILARNFEEVRSICEATPSESKENIAMIISSLPDATRKDVDGFVPIIKKLSDSEKDIFHILEQETEKDVFKIWLSSLLQQKQISRESLKAYCESLLSKTSHKDAASQLLRKNGR